MTKLTDGNKITLGAFAVAIAVSWGTLHARVTNVEKQTEGLVPAVQKLEVAIGKLTTAMKLRHEEGD